MVRDRGSGRQGDDFNKELVHVREWQIREQDRVFGDRVAVLRRNNDAGNVAVQEDRTLRVPGRATRVAKVDVHLGRRRAVRDLVLLAERFEFDDVENLDPDRLAPLRHRRRGLDTRLTVLGRDRVPAVEADDGFDLRHLARKLEKVRNMGRVGKDDTAFRVVDDVLDGVRAVHVVETVKRRVSLAERATRAGLESTSIPDDRERVGGDGLVHVLPLGTVVRPNADLPLDRVRLGEQSLLEVDKSRTDFGSVDVDVAVRLPLDALRPVSRGRVPRAVTETRLVPPAGETDVERFVRRLGVVPGSPLRELCADVDGCTAGFLTARDGLYECDMAIQSQFMNRKPRLCVDAALPTREWGPPSGDGRDSNARDSQQPGPFSGRGGPTGVLGTEIASPLLSEREEIEERAGSELPRSSRTCSQRYFKLPFRLRQATSRRGRRFSRGLGPIQNISRTASRSKSKHRARVVQKVMRLRRLEGLRA